MLDKGEVSWLRVCLVCAPFAISCAGGDAADLTTVQENAAELARSDSASRASTVLRDAEGTTVGRVTFKSHGDATLVTISARLSDDQEGIHGIHIHANDVADNGEGCIADPAQPANTHFVSVDGHYNPTGATHGQHQGDMPALFFTEDGAAWMQFSTDRFQPDELRGRAVILHASSDNYGNVPVGDADDQYTPNSAAATDATAKTGNAGARIACGVID